MIGNHRLLFSINAFIFITFIIDKVTSKYYDKYASYEGCEPLNLCPYKTYEELFKSYIRGLGPDCEDEKAAQKSYFDCADNYFECGFLNLYENKDTFSINEKEGVMILNGLDVSNLTNTTLIELGISDHIIQKLTPFFGVRGTKAYNKLESEKLRLTSEEAKLLYDKVTNQKLQKLEKIYENKTNSKNFSELPLEVRTGLLSQFSIYEDISDSYVKNIIEKNWDELSKSVLLNKFPENLKNGQYYTNIFRKNLDSYLIDSADYKVQNSHLKGVFLIDVSNAYKADLKVYETYINSIQKILKDFYKVEKCETCLTQDVHDYAIILFDNKTNRISNFTSTYNHTIKEIENIFIPGSYEDKLIIRNTGAAIDEAIKLINNQTSTFDKVKTIMLFTNGDSSDDVLTKSKELAEQSINFVVIDMSKEKSANLLSLADGSYNYIYYDFNKILKRDYIVKQVVNLFASQDINLGKKFEYKNSSMDHNNTVHFQAVKEANKNLKMSLFLNTFPEQNILKMFVAYNYPYPEYETSKYIHEGTNNLPLKTVVIGEDENDTKAFSEKRTVYITLIGANSDFGLKIEDCDPKDCPLGTNLEENKFQLSQWVLAVLILLICLLALYFVWYLMRCYRKRQSEDDIDKVFATKYSNI